jgi:hypothetical protein
LAEGSEGKRVFGWNGSRRAWEACHGYGHGIPVPYPPTGGRKFSLQLTGTVNGRQPVFCLKFQRLTQTCKKLCQAIKARYYRAVPRHSAAKGFPRKSGPRLRLRLILRLILRLLRKLYLAVLYPVPFGEMAPGRRLGLLPTILLEFYVGSVPSSGTRPLSDVLFHLLAVQVAAARQ